jgi:hypothetical protein
VVGSISGKAGTAMHVCESADWDGRGCSVQGLIRACVQPTSSLLHGHCDRREDGLHDLLLYVGSDATPEWECEILRSGTLGLGK